MINRTQFNVQMLVKLVQKGNKQAFNQLFEIYHQKLFLYSFRILKSKEKADDIVQESFIKLWENRAALNHTRSLDGFIFRIAKNLIIDSFRKLSREDNFKIELAASIAFFHQQTEHEIIYHDMKKIIDQAIDLLPQQRQLVFRLSRENGLSHKEIADKLSISENTVKVHINKSLHLIHGHLVKNTDISLPAIILILGNI